jgi:hypothetical protein
MSLDYKKIAVGWLSGPLPPDWGNGPDVHPNVINILDYMIHNCCINRCFGHHICEYCGFDNKTYGNGELWLPDHKLKIIWIAPVMITHYIASHGFLPPREFLEAVVFASKEDCHYFSQNSS